MCERVTGDYIMVRARELLKIFIKSYGELCDAVDKNFLRPICAAKNTRTMRVTWG